MAAEKFGTIVFLGSFNIPEVPSEFLERNTLTYISKIRQDCGAYQEALRLPFSIAKLPQTIEALVLDGFNLGYPARFLVQLGQKLPNLQQLTLHRQLLGGIDESTWEDAVTFLADLKHLRRLYLLDVMPSHSLRPDIFATIGKELASRSVALERLTISFTNSNRSDEFLRVLPLDDFKYFIMPTLRVLSLNISLADMDTPTFDQDGNPVKRPLGIQPIPVQLTFHSGIVPALLTEGTAPIDLEFMDLSLFTLDVDQLAEVLCKHTGLKCLAASLYLVPGEGPKKRLLTALSECPSLEEVEIIYYPSLDFYGAIRENRAKTLTMAFPDRNDMDALGGKCSNLGRFDASIFKIPTLGQAEWVLADGGWVGHFANLDE